MIVNFKSKYYGISSTKIPLLNISLKIPLLLMLLVFFFQHDLQENAQAKKTNYIIYFSVFIRKQQHFRGMQVNYPTYSR